MAFLANVGTLVCEAGTLNFQGYRKQNNYSKIYVSTAFLKKMCEKRLVTKDSNFSGFLRDDDITCVSIFSFLLHISYKIPFWGIGVQEKRFKNRKSQFVSNSNKLALGKK